MKVAFYNHTSVVSGAEISLLLTARNMRQAEPVIFAPAGELLERAAASGIHVVEMPSYRARLSRNPLRLMKDMLGMLRAGFAFARTIRSQNFDLIHANSLRAGIMAALFVWLHRRPLIWHVRDIPPRGTIGKAINRLASASVKGLIGISKSVLQGFDQNRLSGKLHLVHNGVELRHISEMERQRFKKSIRNQLQTPQQRKVMVIIGQITPWKRQKDAIRTAHRLLHEGHDVQLWVIGEAKFRAGNTAYLESLRKLAADLDITNRVTFTGFREDVIEIICAADLLVLCSDNEPFGRVIIEAMSQGLPVVATNAGGVHEIIEHDRSGLLYEVGDIDGLVRCADRLLQNDSMRQSMGKLASARVQEHFTIQSTVAKIEDVYRTVLRHKQGIELPYAKEVNESV